MPNSDFRINNGRILCAILIRMPLLFLIDEFLKFGIIDFTNDCYKSLINGTLFASTPPIIEISELISSFLPFTKSRQETQAYRVLLDEQSLSNFTKISDIYPSPKMYDTVWQYLFNDDLIASVYLPTINILLSLAGCALVLLTCFLNISFLIGMYKFMLSFGIIILSYKSHIYFANILVKQLQSIEKYSLLFLCQQMSQHGALQYVLGLMYWHFVLEDWRNNDTLVDVFVPGVFAIPTLLSIFLNTKVFLTAVNVIIIALFITTLAILYLSFEEIYDSVYEFYIEKIHFFRNFGLLSFLEFELNRLQIPSLLRCFWIIRTLISLNGYLTMGRSTFEFDTLKFILIRSCDSLLMIISLSSIIGKIFFLVSEGIRWILLTNEIDETISSSMAILNLVLSIQTGLIDLDNEKRFRRLLKNFCLMLMAFLHSMHSVVNATLMSLSVPSKPFFWKHVRALFVAVILIIFPVIFIRVLCDFNEVSTWLVTLLAFGVECLMKYSISVIIYTLYLIDSKSDGVWERLDDYVYYIHSFGSILDFVVGVLLFFNGLWILIFERSQLIIGSLIRAIMMGIHVYQNIWKEAKSGLSSFKKRRTALLKVNSLKDATINQLRVWNDICAICFQDMVTAKVTTCNHYFHTMCLKKWLYVQDHCPLCHKILHALTTD